MSTRSSLVKFLIFVVATLLATGTLAATISNTQFGDKATYRGTLQGRHRPRAGSGGPDRRSPRR